MAIDLQSSAHQNSLSVDTVNSDEILEEIYAFRGAYATQFDYDIEQMFADLAAFAKNNPGPLASIEPLDPGLPEK